MPNPSPDPAHSADADDVPPIDVAAVLEIVRRTKTPRRAVPPVEVMRKLVDQLRDHTVVLVRHDLGPDDEELKAIREGAEECCTRVPALLDEGARAEAWLRVYEFGIVAEALLGRWCQADTAGGAYELRVEDGEHGGYCVWDTVGAGRAWLRNRQGRRPAAHLPLDAAWELTRRLNQGTR